MMNRAVLLVIGCGVVAMAAPIMAQDGRGERRPGEDRPRGTPPGMMRMSEIDPETDEVLVHIEGATTATEDQMAKVIALYRTLRHEQMKLARAMMMQAMRGPGDDDGADGDRPGRPEDAERAERRRPGADRMGAMIQELNERVMPMNDRFFEEARLIFDGNQRELFDMCIKDIDLSPRMFAPRARRGQGGNLDPASGPAVGAEAPNFTLADLDGAPVSLADLRGKPVVMEFGSYTCPIFRGKINAFEELQKQYGSTVHFVLVYTREAHPIDGWEIPAQTENDIVIKQHTTYDERLTCAKRTRDELGVTTRILVDDIDNTVTTQYAGAPNRGYVLDADGKVVSKQVWINVSQTRLVLDELLGGV